MKDGTLLLFTFIVHYVPDDYLLMIAQVTQAHDNLKEDLCGQITKLKKPKVTNPKPFRLRTDVRISN